MSGDELPKVIDKSYADIEAAIAAIQSNNLSSGTKEFTISCIKLAVWLPKALLEHRIKLSNLRKLIFGFGRKSKKKSNQENDTEKFTQQEKENNNHVEKSNEQNDSSEIKTSNSLAAIKKGHGRLAHSAYANTIEHQLKALKQVIFARWSAAEKYIALNQVLLCMYEYKISLPFSFKNK